MILNIAIKLINEIADKLFAHGYDKLYNELHNTILASEPKEINYKNYGEIVQGTLEQKMDKWLAEKGGTDYNYLSLKRDNSGRFLPKHKKIYKFKYNSLNTGIKDREIEWIDMDKTYITGLDRKDGLHCKNFRRDRIIGRVKVSKEKI